MFFATKPIFALVAGEKSFSNRAELRGLPAVFRETVNLACSYISYMSPIFRGRKLPAYLLFSEIGATRNVSGYHVFVFSRSYQERIGEQWNLMIFCNLR